MKRDFPALSHGLFSPGFGMVSFTDSYGRIIYATILGLCLCVSVVIGYYFFPPPSRRKIIFHRQGRHAGLAGRAFPGRFHHQRDVIRRHAWI